MCWLELGLVLARPLSERPLPLVPVVPLLPLDPHAATAIAHAIATTGASANRIGRI